jgi:hypothetical protein
VVVICTAVVAMALAHAAAVKQRCLHRCSANVSAAGVVTILIGMGLVVSILDFEELYSRNSTEAVKVIVPPGPGPAPAPEAVGVTKSSNYTQSDSARTNPSQALQHENSHHSPPLNEDMQSDRHLSKPNDSQDKDDTVLHDQDQSDSQGPAQHDLSRPTRFQVRSSSPDTSLSDAIPDSTTFEKRFPSLWRAFRPSAAKYPKGFKPLLPSDVGLKPTPLDKSLPYVVSDEKYAMRLAPQLLKHRKNPYICLAKPVNDCLRTLFYRGASHPGVVRACQGFEYTTGAHFQTYQDLASAVKTGALAKHWDDYICAKNGNNNDTFCDYNPATLMIEPPVQKAAVQDVLNVVAIQLDAISRARFRYIYPETAKYLENMNDPTSTEAKDSFSRAFDFP